VAWRANSGAWWSSFGTVNQLVLVACTIWILIGLGLFVWSQLFKQFPLIRLQKPVVSAYALIISLAIIELFLTFAPGENPKPALWPPGREILLEPNPEDYPGVTGSVTFRGNNVGLRGPDLPLGETIYKIVTIGGSTTQNLVLDDTETWTYLLADGLNERNPRFPVWSGNGGQSGRNTVDHLALMESLPIVAEADLLIFLIGMNDLLAALAYEGDSSNEPLQGIADRLYNQVLKGGGWVRPIFPLFKHFELYEIFSSSKPAEFLSLVPANVLGQLRIGTGSYINEQRQRRAEGPIVALPNLEIGLKEYEQRVLALSRTCREFGTRCLFLTQPSIYRATLSQAERSLLWFGRVGLIDDPKGFVSSGDLRRAMEKYNSFLLNICKKNNLVCYDLASQVPKNTSAFYDDMHFNESGAQIVADNLTEYLHSKPPFSTE